MIIRPRSLRVAAQAPVPAMSLLEYEIWRSCYIPFALGRLRFESGSPFNFILPPLALLVRIEKAMAPSRSILLRFESKNGQFRMTVDPADDFTSMLAGVMTVRCSFGDMAKLMTKQILDKLPKDADSRSIVLSNKPANGEDRLLSSLKGVPIQKVGLRYVISWAIRKASSLQGCEVTATNCSSNTPNSLQ